MINSIFKVWPLLDKKHSTFEGTFVGTAGERQDINGSIQITPNTACNQGCHIYLLNEKYQSISKDPLHNIFRNFNFEINKNNFNMFTNIGEHRLAL